MKKFICENCGADLLKKGFYAQAWNVYKKADNGKIVYSHSDNTSDEDVYCENCNTSLDSEIGGELISLITE